MIKKWQLPLQTLNLTVGFMIWVILSSLLPFIKEDIHIPAGQLAWVTGTSGGTRIHTACTHWLLYESLRSKKDFYDQLYTLYLPGVLY